MCYILYMEQPTYLLVNKKTGSTDLMFGRQVEEWWGRQEVFSGELSKKFKLIYLGCLDPVIADILYGRGRVYEADKPK